MKTLMLCLRNNRNNLHLKQVFPVQNIWEENDMGINIEYDVKSCQVQKSMVNCTGVQLKVLKI